MDKRLSVYMKYGEKADTCSIFANVCPNHFEMCPIRVVYGWPGRVAQSVGHLTRKSGVLGSIPGLATYFRFSFR